MRPRLSSSTNQRSKSLPTKTPHYPHKRMSDPRMERNRASLQIKQLMRSSTIEKNLKTGSDKEKSASFELQKVISQFSRSLNGLQLDNSDIVQISKLLKQMKEISAQLMKVFPVKEDVKNQFMKIWNDAKELINEKTNKYDDNGEVLSYEGIASQLHLAKNNLEKVQQKMQNSANAQGKAQVLETLYDAFDDIDFWLRRANELKSEEDRVEGSSEMQNHLDQEFENINQIQSDLKRLQTAVPTGKSNQIIGKVILQLKLLQSMQKVKQSAKLLISRTEVKMNNLIEARKDESARSHRSDYKSISSRSKSRSKSLGNFDNKSHVSSLSRKSSYGTPLSRKIHDLERKTSELRNQYVSYDRNLSVLRDKILKAQKGNDDLEKELEDLIQAHSKKRSELLNQITRKIRNSENPNFEDLEQNEITISNERQILRRNKDLLEMLDSQEYHELSDEIDRMKNTYHLLEYRQEDITNEIQRAEGVSNGLKRITSESKEGSIDIKMDNHSLQKETDQIYGDLKKKQRSIDNWIKSWKIDSGNNFIGGRSKEYSQGNDISLIYQKNILDQKNLQSWSNDLDAELNELTTESELLKKAEPKIDNSEKFKEASFRWNRMKNSIGDSNGKTLSEQIRMTRYQIKELESIVSERKSDSISVEEHRSQNRQMLDWISDLLEQIKDALSTQSALKGQLNSNNHKLDKAIQGLSDANFERSQIRTDYKDSENQMQQLYTIIFGEQTDEQFMSLYPYIRERVSQLIEYRSLVEQNSSYNHGYSDEESG